jgi:hypothetical protein
MRAVESWLDKNLDPKLLALLHCATSPAAYDQSTWILTGSLLRWVFSLWLWSTGLSASLRPPSARAVHCSRGV